jgi:hypothetical protein
VFELERRGYLSAGAYVPEVVEKLRAVGRENDMEKINRQAVRLATRAAEPFHW